MRYGTVLALVAALGLAAWVSPASGGSQAGSAAVRTCLPFTRTYNAYVYHFPVKIFRGKISCKTARSVLKTYYLTGKSGPGWACRTSPYPYVKYLTRCLRPNTEIRSYRPR